MSRISEFEPRRRKVDDRREGRSGRKSRRSWPASAWLVAGTMIALNLGLGAFIVKNEFNRGTFGGEHGRRHPVGVAPSPKPAAHLPVSPIVDAAKIEPQPVVQSSQIPHTKQTSKPLAAQASKAGTSKTAAAPGQWAAVRRQPPAKPYQPEMYPQNRFVAPQTYSSQAPAPVYPAVHVPAPLSAPGEVDTPPALVASVRTPAVGAQSPADSSRKVIAPAASGTAARKTQPALDLKAGQGQKQPIRVASVGLPRMDKGLVVPKTPVGTASPVIEVVRRPQGPKAEVENCGGEVVVPCPTLHKRPTGGTPEGDRW